MAIYVGTAGADSIDGGATDDTLIGNGGADTLNGGAGNDSVEGSAGSQTLIGGTGNDTLNGAAGDDTYYVDGMGDVIVEATGGGTDIALASSSYALSAGAEVEVLGYAAAPKAGSAVPAQSTTANVAINLTGNGFAQTLQGTAGANVLDGGRNANAAAGDTLSGYDGDDTYIVRNILDTITNETGGNDIVYVSVSDLEAQGQAVATYSLGATTGIDTISAANQRGTENLVLTGSSADAQQVVGNFGNNTLSGGGGGVDTLIGLEGNDTYSIVTGTEVIVESLGTDSIVFAAGNTVAGGAYTLAADVSIEQITLGNGVTSVTGNNLAQTITGTAAAETLNGGGGVDTLIGGDGNDTYIVDVDGETITEATGKGADVLIFNGKTGGFNLADGVSVETMAVGNATTGARLGFGDSQTAGAAAGVYLVGNDQSQIIFGAGGNDILNGERGTTTNADTLYGGAGNDIYRVYASTDIVSEGQFDAAGVIDNTKDAGGNDTIYTSATYSLASVLGGTIETLSTADQAGTASINLTGAANANTLIGNFGKNTLDGGLNTGAFAGKGDTLSGLNGDDTYILNQATDFIIEASGHGTDTLNFAAGFKDATGLAAGTSYVLDSEAEVDVINLSNGVVDITGSKYAQVINGATGNVDETIRGGGGADLLRGGGGNDTYIITDGSAGVVIEDTQGVNVVQYSGTTGGVNVGNSATVGSITATAATGDVYLVGNSGVQTITGNSGNNILNGAGGLDGAGKGDTLVGGAGNDTYRVYNSNFAGTTTAAAVGDVVVENAGEGTDTVYTSANYVLTANVENLIAADQANVTTLTLVGNASNNVISGSNGNNVLVGGAGNDYLTGLGGADTFHFAETGIGNTDTIADFNSAQGDKISLDAGVFAGFGPSVDGAEFQNGTVATGNQATILYDQATGRIFYDADGAGAGAAVLFAQLTPGTALSASDFVLTPAGTLPTAI